MPETPDFEQIADQIINDHLGTLADSLRAPIVEQLRLVWNARGAADLKAIADAPIGVGIGRTEAIDRFRALDR